MTGSRSRMPLLALGAAAGALAAALAMLSRPDPMIGAGFDAALAKARQADSGRVVARAVDAQAFDPRHLRPSSLAAGRVLPVLGPVKVGEHMRLATHAGEQVLEVVAVHPLPRTVLGADDGTGGGLVLVTLRAQDDSGATVRLLLEVPAEPALPAPAVTRRAL